MDVVLSLSLKRKNKIEEMEKMKMIFKSGGVATCLFAAAFSSVTCGLTAAEQPQQAEYVFHGAGNPYLPLWEHLPDGEPRVFEDPDNPGKYRAYIIGSHDLRMTSYCGPDIRMW